MPLSLQVRDRLMEAVEDRKHKIVSFLQDLIRIPTETHPPGGDEKRGQELISRRLTEIGLEVEEFLPTDVKGIESHVGYWPGLDYTDRPNVVGTAKGTGGGRSLILNGHIDVVPAGPRESWSVDPYGGDVINGYVYGRGSVDMKAGIAGMIEAVQAVKDAKISLKGDVIIQSVVNEELGGYNGTLACILKGYKADAAIVTEPTQLRICPGHKGGQAYRMRVPGLSAHAAQWWSGVSAVDLFYKLKEAMTQYQEHRSRRLEDNPLFADKSLFPITALVDTVYAVQAGDPNIMACPPELVAHFWVDALPGEELEDVLGEFEAYIREKSQEISFLKEHPVELERAVMRPFYPTSVPLDHPLIEVIEEMHKEVVGSSAVVCGFESACEAMMFNYYSSIPALIFGPGNLERAHRPDECVSIDELLHFTKILALTIVSWCGYEG